MKIYFGKADQHDVEHFGDEGVFSTMRNGKVHWFYQGVEHGTNAGGMDEVRIFDGCNRSIPICIETIPELIEALQYCYNNHESIQQGKSLEERIESDEVAFVESEQGYTLVNDCNNSLDEDEF